MIHATVRGMPKLQRAAQRAPGIVKRAIIFFLRKLEKPIEDEVKNRIRTGARTGNIVRRSNPPRVVQASAPGQPPLDDTGQLVASIDAKVNEKDLSLRVSALAFYAYFLEFGTRRMLPRPFLAQTLTRRWRDRIIEAIAKAVRSWIK